jgi:hypothetical protein
MPHGADHVAVALPCLTASLVHSVQVHPAALFHSDRTRNSKRCSELDVAGLINAVVNSVLLPAMQQHVSGFLAQTAALSSLRLAHAQPKRPWVLTCSQWAVTVLREGAKPKLT